MPPSSIYLTLLALLVSFPAHALTIVYTNDVMGELEPCGCRNNPTGGLARKSELIRRLKDSSIVQVDAGNLLFDSDEVPSTLAAQAEVQAGYQIRAHEALGHDLVTPGTKDFGLGPDVFRKLTSGSKIRFLSVNLFDRSGKRLLEPNAILERPDPSGKVLRLGFIGVSYPTPNWQKHRLEARDPLPLLQEEVKRLRPKVDRLYLISQLGQTADEGLAESISGIDGIFGGRTQSLLQTPVKIGKTTIFQSSFRNQYVGTYNVLTGAHKLTPLDVGYEPESKNHPIVQLVSEMKSKIGETNRNQQAPVLARDTPDAPASHFQSFARCAECHAPQFDFWRKSPHSQALKPLLAAKQHENKDCLRCHTVGMGEKNGWDSVNRLGEVSADHGMKMPLFWPAEDMDSFLTQMREAPSMDTPVRLYRDSVPMPMSAALSKVQKAWTPVQCENCHSPGGDHPFGTQLYAKAVPNSQCLKCHTQERAPQWYGQDGKLDQARLIASRKKVACPANQ
jgi:hypothetical protein